MLRAKQNPKVNKQNFLLLLASKSPRRSKLLRSGGLQFQTIASRYKEEAWPKASVVQHALGKTLAAILPERNRGRLLVMGADTLVLYRGHRLGKPKTKREAMRMLSLLSGKTHHVVTAIALIDPLTGRRKTASARTYVTFKKLDKPAILRYLEAVNPLDKAGGYAIQEGPSIVRKIRGSRSNVIGLPMELLKKKLKEIQAWYK